jgi:hypothetical protein
MPTRRPTVGSPTAIAKARSPSHNRNTVGANHSLV